MTHQDMRPIVFLDFDIGTLFMLHKPRTRIHKTRILPCCPLVHSNELPPVTFFKKFLYLIRIGASYDKLIRPFSRIPIFAFQVFCKNPSPIARIDCRDSVLEHDAPLSNCQFFDAQLLAFTSLSSIAILPLDETGIARDLNNRICLAGIIPPLGPDILPRQICQRSDSVISPLENPAQESSRIRFSIP